MNGDGGLKPGFFKAGVASRGFVSCYSSGSVKFSSASPSVQREAFSFRTPALCRVSSSALGTDALLVRVAVLLKGYQWASDCMQKEEVGNYTEKIAIGWVGQ